MTDQYSNSLEMLGVQVDRVVKEAMRAPLAPRSDPFINIDDTSSGNLIGIVGERGSGKTTLLAAVIGALIENAGHIVAPVVRPEMLGPNESILVSTISFLSQLPTTQGGLFSSDEQREEISELAQRALRAAIYMSHDPISDVLSRSGSLGQYASDTAAILYRTADLRADLAALVGKLLAYSGRSAFVVSVDDIDLSPGRLTQVLFDIRILGACPGIVPVACLSMADLRANLRAELARSFPSMEQGSLDRSVAQQVMKTLRPDRIFEPLQLPRTNRLDYTPLGSTEPLRDILATCFGKLEGVNTAPLRDWLQSDVASESTEGLKYAWLPDTYRGLEHLYYSAAALRKSLDSDIRALEVGTQLRRLLANIAGEVPQLQVDLELQSIATSHGRPKLVATANWPNYRVGVSTRTSWKPIFRSSRTRVMLREVATAVASEYHGSYSDNATASAREDRRSLPPKELSAGLVTQSLLSSDLFEQPAPGGPLFLTDGSSEFLQTIRILGLATDDKFVFLPGSGGIVYCGRWLSSWNWMVANSAADRRMSSPLGSVLANNCTAVEHIWLGGQNPSVVLPPEDLKSAFTSVSRSYVRALATVNPDDDWETVPAAAFCDWYEKFVPLSFHEALLSDEELRTVIETWQAAISGSPRTAESLAGLRSVLMRGLEVDESQRKVPPRAKVWMYGYRALVRNVAPDLASYLNDFEKEYNERSGRGSKGREAVEQSIAFSELSSLYQFASRVTEEGREEEALIRRALAQLRP